MTPLTYFEARAIVIADEALDDTFEDREASGKTLSTEEGDAWRELVTRANDRVAAGDAAKDVARADGRGRYTTKRLTGSDLSVIAEMLRVSLEDPHWSAVHARFREIHEKMIERLGDVADKQAGADALKIKIDASHFSAPYPGGNEPDFQTQFAEAMAVGKKRETEDRDGLLTVLACREGSQWVTQAIEQDMASQGSSLLAALADLGCMFDARDHLLTVETNVAPIPRTPGDYERACAEGHYVGILPVGRARVARVYVGISPFERRTP